MEVEQWYQYQPLDMTAGQIRLFQLLPGNDEPVHIKFTVCTMTELTFDALSYSRSGTEEKIYIECEGYIIRISQTLHHFLRLLRQSGHVEPLWADDICIHRISSVEKSTMKEADYIFAKLPFIYNTAQRTLCWAGVEDLPFLQDLTSTTSGVRDYQKVMLECLSAIIILHSPYKIVENDLGVFGKELGVLDSDTWHIMDSFLNQAYFIESVRSFFQLFTD
jgi:hypothetical protein